MEDRDRLVFVFPGRGRVELSVGRCRRLCPAETAQLVAAAHEVAVAQRCQDQAGAAQASALFEQRLAALQAALIDEARRRLDRSSA